MPGARPVGRYQRLRGEQQRAYPDGAGVVMECFLEEEGPKSGSERMDLWAWRMVLTDVPEEIGEGR